MQRFSVNFGEMEKGQHLYAKKLLGEVKEAWQVLLAGWLNFLVS